MSTPNTHRETVRALTAQGRFALAGGPAAVGGSRGAFGQVGLPVDQHGSLPQYPQLDSKLACAFSSREGQR